MEKENTKEEDHIIILSHIEPTNDFYWDEENPKKSDVSISQRLIQDLTQTTLNSFHEAGTDLYDNWKSSYYTDYSAINIYDNFKPSFYTDYSGSSSALNKLHVTNDDYWKPSYSSCLLNSINDDISYFPSFKSVYKKYKPVKAYKSEFCSSDLSHCIQSIPIQLNPHITKPLSIDFDGDNSTIIEEVD